VIGISLEALADPEAEPKELPRQRSSTLDAVA
jgi:hypothetical protein